MGKDDRQMNENSPDIRRLNDAIESLNGDAEGMHALVTKSTEELERATAEGKRVADLAGEALEALAPMAEELRSAADDAKGMISDASATVERLSTELTWAQKEGKEAFDTFSAASHEALSAFRSESLDEARRTRDELLASLGESQEADRVAFDEFASASLKAAEKTRDNLQTDLLSQKTAMAARMDSLEAATTKRLGDVEGALTRLEEETKRTGDSLGERVDLLQKKVSLPLYGVIAVAVLQLITLVALLLR